MAMLRVKPDPHCRSRPAFKTEMIGAGLQAGIETSRHSFPVTGTTKRSQARNASWRILNSGSPDGTCCENKRPNPQPMKS